MNIRIIAFKPFPMYVGSSLKGKVDIAINDQLMLRGLKLFKTALGFHLQLPGLHADEKGSAYNFLSAGLIKRIEDQVVTEYEKLCIQQGRYSTMEYS